METYVFVPGPWQRGWCWYKVASAVSLLDVLEVEGSYDDDPGGQKFFHILPALGVLGAGRIVISDPVYQADLWAPAQNCLHIHCLAIADFLERNDLHGFQQMSELGRQVLLNRPDDHILAARPAPAPLIQHSKRLSDSRGIAKKDL